jgi:1,2-diacylglycerol 3-beta-galactosyltransferase
MTADGRPPVRLLFLIGDTGGGHRSAAKAVAQALDRACPGSFSLYLCDPLRGPYAPRRLRWIVGLYGPAIRTAPWLWGMLWHAYGAPRVGGRLRRRLVSLAYVSVARAVSAWRPAVIVAFHAMTAEPAARARDRSPGLPPVITVITDLITAHPSWRYAGVDRIIVPSAAVAELCARDGMPEGHYVETGLPVAAEFCQPPASAPERHARQQALGLRGRFLVVLTGGAEGSGGMYRRTVAILGQVENVDVAVICGRNQRLRRRLTRLAERAGGRLTVHGFVDNMADWLRCADVVVGKAGPGTIAEATCCAAPLVLTSYVPGQEEGNAEFVVQAGAGRYAPRPGT